MTTRPICRVLLAALTTALGATANAAWHKGDATPEQLKRDQSQCEMRARSDADFGRIDPGSPGTRAGASLRSTSTMVRESRAFEFCMRERGYEWIDAKPAQKKPGSEALQKEAAKGQK